MRRVRCRIWFQCTEERKTTLHRSIAKTARSDLASRGNLRTKRLIQLLILAAGPVAAACSRDAVTAPYSPRLVQHPFAFYGGDTVEGAYARVYRGDSVLIEVVATSSNCNLTNSVLWALWSPGGSLDWLSYNACAATGQKWMKHPLMSVDSGGVFMTTSYDSAFVFGTANLRIGDYPKYTFLLKRGMNGGTYGDIEVCVTIFPCHRTGDPVLDNDSVRAQLLQAMQRSNPDSTPRSMKRREIGGGVFQRVSVSGDTTYYAKEAPNYLAQTACRNSFGYFPPDSSGDVVVAIWHTHPNSPADTVYGCAGGQQTPTGIAQSVLPYGGGSPQDWAAADSADLPVYVMTKDGVIARLEPNVTNRTGNQNVFYWKNDPTGCRAWTAPR